MMLNSLHKMCRIVETVSNLILVWKFYFVSVGLSQYLCPMFSVNTYYTFEVCSNIQIMMLLILLYM